MNKKIKLTYLIIRMFCCIVVMHSIQCVKEETKWEKENF